MLYLDQGREESDDRPEDDEQEGDDGDELAQAARAGIRLLEENAQLQDELQTLQSQLAHIDSEKGALLELLGERDGNIDKLSTHLRECIRENQGVLSELEEAKKRIDFYQQQLKAQASAAASSVTKRSPGKLRRQSSSPRKFGAKVQSKQAVGSSRNGGDVSDDTEAVDDNESNPVMEEQRVPALRRASDSSALHSSKVLAAWLERAQTTPELKEAEAKVDEEQRRNSILRMQLSSAQKQVHELRPLQSKLQELSAELEVAHSRAHALEQQLEAVREDRDEEHKLLQSLRNTIEIYQTLDHPLQDNRIGSFKLDEWRPPSRQMNGTPDEPNDDGSGSVDARRTSTRHRRRSEGCVLSPPPPSFVLGSSSPEFCVTSDRFSLRDENDRLVNEINHLSKQILLLKVHDCHSSACQPPGVNGVTVATGVPTQDASVQHVATADRPVSPNVIGSSSRTRLLEQQVSVLQDLLRRFRSQWKKERSARRAAESEKVHLIGRMESMQSKLTRQCEACLQKTEAAMADEFSVWSLSDTMCKALFERAAQDSIDDCNVDDVEQLCFAIMHRVVDSWTTDNGKRMQLHDWLMSAVRGTGKQRPLQLFDLSSEIAAGFQTVLAPILCEQFGVKIQVEKRLRHVIVTDLKLNVAGTNKENTKVCQQRIDRSLLRLGDVETTWMESKDWVDSFARRRAARMCTSI